LTCLGNDFAFEEIFARQVEAFGQPGDVLLVFTTSGNSPNVLRALAVARRRSVKTIALLGRDGGAARGQADIELIVAHDETARIQEAHQFLLHAIMDIIEGVAI
jgi:D-sedoheptulose 7-phosphate isomerase